MTNVTVNINEQQLKQLLHEALGELQEWSVSSDHSWPREQLDDLKEELEDCLGFVYAYKQLVDIKEK